MCCQKRMTYSADAVRYLEKHVSLEKVLKDIREVEEELMEKYADYLEVAGVKSIASGLTFGNETVEAYKRKFFHSLLNSYRVFDVSHNNYPILLNVVAVNNPEWVDAVKRDHDEKVKRCKVDIYPFDSEKTA